MNVLLIDNWKLGYLRDKKDASLRREGMQSFFIRKALFTYYLHMKTEYNFDGRADLLGIIKKEIENEGIQSIIIKEDEGKVYFHYKNIS
jgi:hypothetical protein